MSPQNNDSLFNQGVPALPLGDSQEGKTSVAFWHAQAEWTAKVASVPPAAPDDAPNPER